uniref:RRM domain-containing protein n=1 Tax=Eptatretus burgeri TaxID=7764 RepID=A0A8C4N910_EPTBU
MEHSSLSGERSSHQHHHHHHHHHQQQHHTHHHHHNQQQQQSWKSYKLLVDPALKKGHQKVYRYDGIAFNLPNAGFPAVDVVRDPRHRRVWSRSRDVDLPVPKFKIDEFYVGQIPPKEVTFVKLNDNVKESFLAEMCKRFGELEEVEIVYNPKNRKHLGLAKVVFTTVRGAKEAVKNLHNTSVMGSIIHAQLDIKGEQRKKYFNLIVSGKFTPQTVPAGSRPRLETFPPPLPDPALANDPRIRRGESLTSLPNLGPSPTGRCGTPYSQETVFSGSSTGSGSYGHFTPLSAQGTPGTPRQGTPYSQDSAFSSHPGTPAFPFVQRPPLESPGFNSSRRNDSTFVDSYSLGRQDLVFPIASSLSFPPSSAFAKSYSSDVTNIQASDFAATTQLFPRQMSSTFSDIHRPVSFLGLSRDKPPMLHSFPTCSTDGEPRAAADGLPSGRTFVNSRGGGSDCIGVPNTTTARTAGSEYYSCSSLDGAHGNEFYTPESSHTAATGNAVRPPSIDGEVGAKHCVSPTFSACMEPPNILPVSSSVTPGAREKGGPEKLVEDSLAQSETEPSHSSLDSRIAMLLREQGGKFSFLRVGADSESDGEADGRSAASTSLAKVPSSTTIVTDSRAVPEHVGLSDDKTVKADGFGMDSSPRSNHTDMGQLSGEDMEISDGEASPIVEHSTGLPSTVPLPPPPLPPPPIIPPVPSLAVPPPGFGVQAPQAGFQLPLPLPLPLLTAELPSPDCYGIIDLMNRTARQPGAGQLPFPLQSQLLNRVIGLAREQAASSPFAPSPEMLGRVGTMVRDILFAQQQRISLSGAIPLNSTGDEES